MCLFPDSWNGAGGPPGNRYIIASIRPCSSCFRGHGLYRPWWRSWGAWRSSGRCCCIRSPPPRTWLNVERAPLHWLPVELSLINDLPVRLEPKRGPIIFIDAPRCFTYFSTATRSSRKGRASGWRAGASDVIIRTEYPLARLEFDSSKVPNTVTIHSADTRGPPCRRGRLREYPHRAGPALGVYGSCAYMLQVKTTAGFFPPTGAGVEGRALPGVFLKSRLYGSLASLPRRLCRQGAAAAEVGDRARHREDHDEHRADERQRERRLERQAEPREVEPNVASRTPKPFTETGSIWTMNDSGTRMARCATGAGMCKACAIDA